MSVWQTVDGIRLTEASRFCDRHRNERIPGDVPEPWTETDQDREALSNLAWEAAISTITTNAPAVTEAGPANLAIALREVLPETTNLSAAELALMREWLDRLASPGHP